MLVLLFLLGLRQSLHSGITSGYALALLCTPLWVMLLRRFRGAVGLMTLGALTLVSGFALQQLAAADHAVSLNKQFESTALLMGILAGAGVVLWARTVVPIATVGAAFGAGMLAHGALFGAGAQNPWKNTWAIPLAITLLAVAAHDADLRPRRAAARGVAVLLLLTLVSAVSDSRSYSATFLICAILAAWQARPDAMSRRGSIALTISMLVGLSAATYWLGTRLLVSGYLGANAQARTIEQIDQSGSVILGGRPELQATLSLMRHRPLGFGVGVVPTDNDVLVAKRGLSSINYNPNNGYVEKFMFGGHIELHSLLGDLWAGWGVAGVLLLALFVFHIVRALAFTIKSGAPNPVLLFVSVWTLWNVLFSPIYSSAPTLIVAVGLALAARDRRPARPPAPVSPGAGVRRAAARR
ncbi:hypothetical protein [uncultured Jatrophihabitans sp.]|uniref:hypothetical protein n=1 Tax=uncultured Jatrophihabitans sp. TaxID=1610747 RepID=UPI0035CB667B